jgi:hypothetical protein
MGSSESAEFPTRVKDVVAMFAQSDKYDLMSPLRSIIDTHKAGHDHWSAVTARIVSALDSRGEAFNSSALNGG